jgi:hypothetical protein
MLDDRIVNVVVSPLCVFEGAHHERHRAADCCPDDSPYAV